MCMNINITRRAVEESDFETIFAWRNDPETIQTTRSVKEIAKQEHLKWSTERILRHLSEPYFAYCQNDELISVTRLDNLEQEFEVSILVSPAMRSKKVATFSLLDTIRYSKTHFPEKLIVAWIRDNNFPSIRLFVKCGFSFSEQKENFVKYII